MIRKVTTYLLITLSFVLAQTQYMQAQYGEYPFEISHYSMVEYDSNKLKFPDGKDEFQVLYSKMDHLVSQGKGQINIVHYGGSHVQADIFSGACRTHFQSLEGGQNAGRGFVFPYRLARTNTPYGYYFRYTGDWETCRNVQRKESCTLGMAGISATTTDTLSSLTLLLEPDNDLDYSFNRIKIYHITDSTSYSIRLDSQLVLSQKCFPEAGYTEIQFSSYVDSLHIEFVKSDSLQTQFELFGINLETDDAGFVYHNMGINGAATASFLRCNRMAMELKSLKPDLVIFGIGINDAYGNNFNSSLFETNYDSLVSIVKASNPNVAIIFLTNNDSYYRKRYLNKNGLQVQQSMYNLAKKHQAAVWDLFEIMGGLNSIVAWQKSYLAKKDRIHFTGTGYLLLGDLLYDAVMQNYGDYLGQQYDAMKLEANLKIAE